MATPKATQFWKKIKKETAPDTHQRLKNEEAAVIINTCINFIYAHGSMSEWIYRKSGSCKKIDKILKLFKKKAFAVLLNGGDINEHDVAGALKKFIRNMPDSLFGDLAIAFITIASLKSTEDKMYAYKELLFRLPKIEYRTLKMLIGHLSFIASLEVHNKMDVHNLALIWGTTLMANSSQSVEAEHYFHFQNLADVVADLIKLYDQLFQIRLEVVKKDLMAAAEVKHSRDFGQESKRRNTL